MRILFVAPYVPSLIRVRPFNFIKHLSEHHGVTLVALMHGDPAEADALQQMRQCCERVFAVPLSKVRSVMSCCGRLLTGMPLQAAYTYFPSVRELVSRIAKSHTFDVLHVEHIRGAHLAEGVKHIPRVFDSVDCITRLLKLRLVHQRGVLQRAVGIEELVKMRSYEPRIAGTFDGITVTSKRDKRALETLMRRFTEPGAVTTKAGRDATVQSDEFGTVGRDGNSRVSVVPNGVDSEYFRPMEARVERGSMAFVGRMSYFANASAAIRFCREVFPRVKRQRPDATFKIIGSDPPEAVRKLGADPAVEVTGYMPDIRRHLAAAEVVVCPLAVGVGVQNKVLEAMAMGKPVVGTSVAYKGIPDAIDRWHVIRADDPTQIADSVLGLFNHPDYALELGERGRRLVEERYSWAAAVRQLEAVHTQAADLHKGRIL